MRQQGGVVLTIGIDAHKTVHAAVAIDSAGREVGQWRGPNHPRAWKELQAWAASLDDERQWGVEGAWSYGRGLSQHLVGVGERVYEINSRWTAYGRRRGRKQDKTDGLDARAVALFVRQEAPKLPEVFVDDATSALNILAVERDELVRESNRIRSQLHHLLMHMDPSYKSWLGTLASAAVVRRLRRFRVAGETDEAAAYRAASIRRLAVRLELNRSHEKEIAAEMKRLAAERYEPLTELCGVNLLTAGMLAGLLGPGRRFVHDAQLAAYAGVAPLETSSANSVRHRLNRSGNRRLNSIIYRIGITQAHHSPEARAYLARRVAQGKSRREAHSALRRYLARALWRLWQRCLDQNEIS
jgi:transposase